MKKLIVAALLTLMVATPAFPRERGGVEGQDYTIRDKNYSTKGYVRDGKIYDKNYRLDGYIKDNKVYDREYRLKYYLDKPSKSADK